MAQQSEEPSAALEDQPLIDRDHASMMHQDENPRSVFQTFIDRGCCAGISYKAGAQIFGCLQLLEAAIAITLIVLDRHEPKLITFAALWAVSSLIGACGIFFAHRLPSTCCILVRSHAVLSLTLSGYIPFIGLLGCVFLPTPIPLLVRLQLEQFFDGVDDSAVRYTTIGLTVLLFINYLYAVKRIKVATLELYRRLSLTADYEADMEIAGNMASASVHGNGYSSSYTFQIPLIAVSYERI